MKIELDKTKERDGKTYHLSLITEVWYFYSNYDDHHPNMNTLGFDRHTNEEVEQKHAYFGLYMYLKNEKHTWISDKLKKIFENVK